MLHLKTCQNHVELLEAADVAVAAELGLEGGMADDEAVLKFTGQRSNEFVPECSSPTTRFAVRAGYSIGYWSSHSSAETARKTNG